ncbi:hypothetical protein [Embleya sp. MST-111070]|uniref:hypothetical protein n=1 Tax=Embleya sp. MST-111070 TaxID=3398231 RepID=UPI003F735C6F
MTPKEFGALEQPLAGAGDVVSAETLLAKVWDEHADPFTTRPGTAAGRTSPSASRPPGRPAPTNRRSGPSRRRDRGGRA